MNFVPKAIYFNGFFSQAVIVDRTMYISGQIGLDPDKMEMVAGGVAQETDRVIMLCKHRFCSSTDFVHIEQKWLATATEIVVLTKMVAISTDFVHFGQKW